MPVTANSTGGDISALAGNDPEGGKKGKSYHQNACFSALRTCVLMVFFSVNSIPENKERILEISEMTVLTAGCPAGSQPEHGRKHMPEYAGQNMQAWRRETL
jgi:hypothetical protein